MDSPPPAAAGFLRLMADYGNLMARVDSEENPHESKYAARKLLEEYMHSLPTGSTAVDSATGFTVGDQLAVADGKLGVNFLQSEETSAAEKPLIHCVEHVVARVGVPPLPQSASDSSSASTAAAPAAAPSPTPLSGPMLLRLLLAGIEACNYLALLYSGWDNHAGALRFLTHAKALFARARACASGADGRPRRAGAAGASDGPADAADGGDSTSAATGDATAAGGATLAGGASAAGGAVGVAGGGGGDVRVLLVSLDALYTHTLFYLAQVHGHLGQQALAHRYIEATLARQLREQAYRATPALPLQQQQQQPADAAVASIETGVGDGGAADADAAAATSAIATPVAAAAGGLSAVFAVDRNEWVRNALRLSELYSGRAQWAAAAHCLAAADVVLHQAVQAVRRDASTAPGADGAAASGGGGGSATSGAAAGAGRSRDPCAQGNLADLPDAMQRLYAELALHWARLYLECMRLGREREAAAAEAGSAAAGAGGGSAAASATGGKLSPEAEKEFERGWDRQWGSGAAALPADAAPAAEEETEDPFTTTPAPKWPSAPKAGGAEASAGAAADVEDDTELLAQLAPSSGAASRAASGTPGGTAAGAVHGGPFAEFLMSQASSVSPSRYSSYGPLHIASPPPPAGQAARAAAAVQPPCPGLCLSGLRLVPVPRTLTSFEAARDVFKAVNVACQRSLAYFPLDGFVSDHVGVQQMLSKAYKYLSFWEADAKRAAAMHGRRVDLLQPLLQQLNTAVYLHLHKELSLEIAGALQEVHELRQARVPAEPTPAKRAAAQASSIEALDRSIAAYAHFLQCYKDDRLKDAPVDAANRPLPPVEGASSLDDGSVEAFFTVHFSVARLLSRRAPPALLEQIASLRAALARFQWILKVADKGALTPAGGFSDAVKRELEMGREMVALLPEKLGLLSQHVALSGGGAARR